MNNIDHIEGADPQLDAVLRDLHSGVSRHVRQTGTAAVRRTVHRRRVTRGLVTGVATVAVIGGVAAAAFAAGRPPQDEIEPATPPSRPSAIPSATASPAQSPVSSATPPASPSTMADIRAVDWKNVRIALPRLGACPARTVKFTNGIAGKATTSGDPHWTINTSRSPGDFTGPVYGDLDGDGTTDALVRINCSIGYPSAYAVVGVRLDSNGQPRVLGEVTSAAPDVTQNLASAGVRDGVVTVVVTDHDRRTGQPHQNTRRLRWDGAKFARTDNQSRIEDLNWGRITLDVPAMPGCPARRVTIDSNITTSDPGWSLGFPGARPATGDLTGDGQAEALVEIQCLAKNPATGGIGWVSSTVVAVALDANDRPYTLGSMTVLPRTRNLHVEDIAISGGTARITLEPIGGGSGGRTETYRWNGSRFIRLS